MLFKIFTIEFIIILIHLLSPVLLISAYENVTKRLEQFDKEFQSMWWLRQSAEWNYSTNVSKATTSARRYASVLYNDWMKEWKLWARQLNCEDLPPTEKQAIKVMASGVVFMNSYNTRLITELKSNLTEVYSSANITLPELNGTSQGESEVISLVGKLRDPDVLKKVWKSWRKQVGEKAKSDFLLLMQLTNKEAQENATPRLIWDGAHYFERGQMTNMISEAINTFQTSMPLQRYSDIGETWKLELGLDDVISDVLLLWDEVKDFYKELHAYVKHKLRLYYGDKHVGVNPWIPAHLLGSLWGDNWSGLSDILLPYPETSTNVTSVLKSKGFSVIDLIRKAEEFYTAMGLDSMKPKFWIKSMFVKPNDGRSVDCHAVSYDFALYEDYRMRMCAEVKEQSFLEAVHEMGHIQYFMAYHKLPMIYRNGANSAFHEAIGETMVYAAQSPKCLQKLNLRSADMPKEIIANTLMKQALSKFVLLPWALTVEIWRYGLFAGEIKEEDMMVAWWELRKEFQGIEPPDIESATLFDPGSKYHVLLHIPYMRYFLSRFLEHQFLEAMCKFAGEDLHSCCFITNKEVGKRLKYMLSLGASVSWKDALEVLTGQRKFSTKPLLNYYEPLRKWLTDYNRNNNISITW